MILFKFSDNFVKKNDTITTILWIIKIHIIKMMIMIWHEKFIEHIYL